MWLTGVEGYVQLVDPGRAVELAIEFVRRRDDTTDVLIEVESGNSASIAVANRTGFSVYIEPPGTPDGHIW